MIFPRPLMVLIYVAFMLPVLSQAEVRHDDNRTWRRAGILVSGQQVFSFESSYQNFSDRFSSSGQAKPMGSQFARTVTWNQLVAADANGKVDLRDYMKKNGLSGNEAAATSTYEINQRELGFGLNWAYGLSSGWMIGLKIPLRYTTTRVQQHVELAPQLARGAGQGSQKSILALQGKDLSDRVRELAQEELSNSGYDQIPTQKQTWDFGDISLLSQESLMQTYHWAWSLQQLVRFPTAQNPSVSDYIQTSRDEGPVNLGITSLLDYQVRRCIFGVRAGYVAQLPDSARMRPAVSSQTGNSTVDPKVSRNLGDWIWAAVDTEYRITRQVDLNAEYSFLSKGKDRYSGDAFSSAEYSQMAEHTDQELHQTRIGMLYRIGSANSRSGVSNKWIASLDYTYPWVGRNSAEAARTSIELINYF